MALSSTFDKRRRKNVQEGAATTWRAFRTTVLREATGRSLEQACGLGEPGWMTHTDSDVWLFVNGLCFVMVVVSQRTCAPFHVVCET